jgi:site-specific recombinase XerD
MPRKTVRNKITSSDLSEQFNKDNVKLIDRFLREKRARSSELTVKNYKSDLDIWQTWNLQQNENRSFVELRKIEIGDFFLFCVEELQWGSARFARMKSTLSSFSNYIERTMDEEFPNFKNIILKAVENLPKSPAREKTILSDDQVDSLFDFIENKLKNPQMACWLALAIASGSRFAELLRFTVDLIDEKNVAFDGIFLETTKSIKTKGRGKSGKMLIKYIVKDIFLPRYKKWMVIRKEIMEKNGQTHDFIFIKSNGEPAKETTVRTWIETMEEFLGVPVYPHTYRHYFTTFLSSKNIPPEFIKEVVGWSSLEMVTIYNDLTAKERSWQGLDNLKK